MTVRFPVYFEVVGYQELDLPNDIDPENNEAVLQFISDSWDQVLLPPMDQVTYVDGTCEFDRDAPYSIIDQPKDLVLNGIS